MACDRHTEEYNVPSESEREREPLLKPPNENNAIDQAIEHSLPITLPIDVEFPSIRIWCGALPSDHLSWHSAANVHLCVYTGSAIDRLRSCSRSIHIKKENVSLGTP